VRGIGVDERDFEPEEPAPGSFVDQLRAAGSKLVEGRADVLDLVRDVVHARAARGEKFADRRLVTERGEQLDAVGADPQRRRLDALVRNGLAMLEPRAEEPLVGRQRLLEVLDGDTEVMNPARLHAADAIRCSSVGGDDPHGADGLGVLRIRLDANEQGSELVLVERFLLE